MKKSCPGVYKESIPRIGYLFGRWHPLTVAQDKHKLNSPYYQPWKYLGR